MYRNVINLKLSLSILSFFFLVPFATGQGGGVYPPDQNDSNREPGMGDLQVKAIRLPALEEVGGSIFFNNEYKLGSVLLDNEKVIKQVPVKFNIFNNAIMVKKEGQELKLESFHQVSYTETETQGSVKQVNFGQGYPDIDNHTATSVYQVLALGPKIQLLKFLSQKVEDVPTLGDYSRREIVTTSELYAYRTGGEMKKIKTGKKAVLEALPDMSGKIEEAIKAGDLNLKNESDIVSLVNTLNQQ